MQERLGRQRILVFAPLRIGEFCLDGCSKFRGSIVSPAKRENRRTLLDCNIDTGRERQHIDDDNRVADWGQHPYALFPPFAANIEFLLVEEHGFAALTLSGYPTIGLSDPPT